MTIFYLRPSMNIYDNVYAVGYFYIQWNLDNLDNMDFGSILTLRTRNKIQQQIHLSDWLCVYRAKNLITA